MASTKLRAAARMLAPAFWLSAYAQKRTDGARRRQQRATDMAENDHFETLVKYYAGSRLVYDVLAHELGVADLTRYYLMDYSNLAFTHACFDAVYTVESLVHSPDLDRTLSEFYRVLKPRGRIALFEYSLADESAFTAYEIDMINKIAQSSAMASLKDCRNDRLEALLGSTGFRAINTVDITDNVAPSVHRLRRYFSVPYVFVKLLRLQRYFPNLAGVVEFSQLGVRGLMKYKVISAIR